MTRLWENFVTGLIFGAVFVLCVYAAGVILRSMGVTP